MTSLKPVVINSSNPRHTAVAGVILIDSSGNLLLQRRDEKLGIASPGMIGIFGGHKEAGESDIACALREIEEELGISLAAHSLELFVQAQVLDRTGVRHEGTFYLARNMDPRQFRISEGSLLTTSVSEVGNHFCHMVPTAAYIVSLICQQVRNGVLTLASASP